MKKLLLLGGSMQQLVAIEAAKKNGYYTVLCDYLTDNPGQYIVDKFYLVSTIDRDAVLEVAKKEAIDGVIAYASDPAAPTAAYVAEKLKLPGNPLWAVETLCNKEMFRKFLHNNGFNAPRAEAFNTEAEALEGLKKFRFPVMVKPVDSSGSKGATVLYSCIDTKNVVDVKEAVKAVNFAFSFSRSHRIIVEEYIERKHQYLIGGDIFVADGEIILWGLMNCHRDTKVNPLVPVGKSYPLKLDGSDVKIIKDTLRNMVKKLDFRHGPMNVELVIDRENRVWPIDVGPRAGGNMIPDLMGMIFGVDVVDMSVRAAMGESVCVESETGYSYYATHNLHSSRSGIYQSITFSEELDNKIVRKCLYKKPGDSVECFDNASKALGIIFMKFNEEAEMDRMLDGIEEKIIIELSEIGEE